MKGEHSITALCQAFEVATSGYYDWWQRQNAPGPRAQEDQRLKRQIRRIHRQSRQTYGAPRIQAVLRAGGQCHGRNRLGRLMREEQICGRQKRRYRLVTTDSNHDEPIAPNRLPTLPPAKRADFAGSASRGPDRWLVRHLSRLGFSFTSVAVQGGTRDSVLATMGLRGTDTFEEIPESDITGAALPSGWYLVTTNRGYATFAEDATLKRLSETAYVVTCFVAEHVMCSAASFWAGGRQVWVLMHEARQKIEHLETKGNLPPIFAQISERLRAEQAAAGGRKAGVDYIFNIPVEMAAHLTCDRHDRVMPGLGARAFEVLATTDARPKRSLLRRLLGV